MKRFITYLYEYERGLKNKNTGFIRVDERKGLVNMQVSVRNFIRSHEKGKVYAYAWENSLVPIELGEIGVINGQGEVQLRFAAEDIKESGFSLDDIVGIGIQFANNGYLASCWKDERAEEIVNGPHKQSNVASEREIQAAEEALLNREFLPQVEFEQKEALPDRKALPQVEYKQQEVLPDRNILPQVEFSNESQRQLTYQKIELNQLRTLPSKNWYLCSNRFLQHGFFSYGYLVLKKETSPAEEVVYLGVPGVFEKPEMVMATIFGFSEFQALPVEIQTAPMNETLELSEIEKSQEPKAGTFGCWLIPLK